MNGGGGVSLAGLAMVAAGAVLVYAGINDPPGGPVAVVTDVIKGKLPTAGTQRRGGSGTFAPGFLSSGTAVGVGAGGTAQAVLSVAASYLGVPYVWAGASRNGMDCSGLVMVAYRDGAGISLPHFATSQTLRGRRVLPREAVQPADLVAWGTPGNYPHIALALNASQVIAAEGDHVQISPLMTAHVPGFGLPDIYRIL